MLTATVTIEILERLQKIPFIEEIEIIEQPDGVEADLSLRLHTIPFIEEQQRSIVTSTIVAWEMQELERTGEMPGIYWEWVQNHYA